MYRCTGSTYHVAKTWGVASDPHVLDFAKAGKRLLHFLVLHMDRATGIAVSGAQMQHDDTTCWSPIYASFEQYCGVTYSNAAVQPADEYSNCSVIWAMAQWE